MHLKWADGRPRCEPGAATRVILGLLRVFALIWTGISSPAWAADAQDDGPFGGLTFQHHTQIVGFVTGTVLNQRSLVNPDNQIAKLPKIQAEIDPRVDLTLRVDPCFLQLKPRGFFVWQGNTPGAGARTSTDAYLNEGRLSCQMRGNVNVEVGRSVLLWGSAILLSPSNPFFAETGKTDPVREQLGRDMVRVSAQITPAWSVEGIYNFHVDTRDTTKAYFSPVAALKVNWTGDSVSASALVSHRDNGVDRLGAYGTWTVSDALLLYGDASVGQGRNALFAEQRAQAPAGWTLSQNQTRDSSWRASALLGASYTLLSGWTQTLELLYNGDGYTSGERRAYQNAIQSGNSALAMGNPAGAALLGQALNPQQNLLGQRYALVQLGRTDLFNKLDVTLRYIQAFDAPYGGNLALSLNYKLSPAAELFAFGQWNVGNPQSEFLQLYRFSVMSGLHYYWN
ncbi:hypothetical protein LMG28614_05024 [Paraburkholderia ultramafica]|uniref:Uncharacterized protein n=1 Tax=Paraburkholderia ultramafica TaxID=1544867 RepID=A0A6S7BGI7_9BURK|nr:hypothetical protein [Paraburkholderia ultramafica]CAB3799678.1 hypothetical protein LMG28614_05024 [Paraburkholderia ultramafica]